MATYLVQVVDKPHQITVSNSFFTLYVLLGVKYVVELVFEIG